MNNRFKFRVWHKLEQKYISENISVTTRLNRNGLLFIDGSTKAHVDNFVIVEFCTGLKDKNGNLIYEGDIVKGVATVDEGGFEYCGVVEWNNQSELIGWYIVDADGNGWELKQAHAKISTDNITGEIIGNIHEQKDAA